MAVTGAFNSGNVNIGATAASVFRPKQMGQKVFLNFDNSL